MQKFAVLLVGLMVFHSTNGHAINTLIEAIGEIVGIASTINDAVNGLAIRHPESDGKCMHIKGAHSFPGAQVILSTCSYPLGLSPVYQRFTVKEGVNSDSVMLEPEFTYSNTCIYSGRQYDDPLFTTSCWDEDKDAMSWRFKPVPDREPRVLMQHVASGRCLKPKGNYIRLVSCNSHDTMQHWIRCKSSDRSCGK